MIYKNNELNNKINNLNASNIHIVTDFDKTLTKGDSESLWGIISKCNVVPEEYKEERQKLYDIYRPIEIDLNISDEEKNMKMTEWWQKHISLLIKYNISEEIIRKIACDLGMMKFRDGAREFFDYLYENNIPVIIISSGIGNFIEMFLEHHNYYYDNIHIISNFIKFESGVAVGMSEPIIHSMNKDIVSISNNTKEVIKDRNNIILMGDVIPDIKMVPDDKNYNIIKIGFLNEETNDNLEEYESNFDMVCTDDISLNDVLQSLKIE